MAQVALITGGAGFIGSHLADKLVACGYQVIAFDNLAIGRLNNISHLKGNPRFNLALGDIGDRDALVHIVKSYGVDTIFHLAAIHYIPYCNQHPYEAIRINVLGTQAVVDAAISGKVKRIVFTSTSDVYAVDEKPYAEDDMLAPYTVYGNSKLFAERLLALATSMHPGLSVAVARLFNAYGPRETNPHVLPEILSQLKGGDTCTVRLGNLWPKRDFVYVEDVADALVALTNVVDQFAVFNVGSGKTFSIEELVALVGEVQGRGIHVVTDPARVREVERPLLHADISKITRTTGWSPRWSLREALARWFNNYGHLPPESTREPRASES